MTTHRFDDLEPEEQEAVLSGPCSHKFASMHAGARSCLFVRDAIGEIFGFCEPAMFEKGEPIKWLEQVISLETGWPITGLAASGKPTAATKAKKDAAISRVMDRKKKAPAVDSFSHEIAGESAVGKSAAAEATAIADAHSAADGAVIWLTHAEILPSPLNPRTKFEEQRLAELKASLHEHGFVAAMSRLWVRPHPTESGKYELVGGERRWRMSGELIAEGALEDRLPAVVSHLSDAEVLELALVESAEHEKLSPLDEAEAICRRLEMADEETGAPITAAKLAKKLGKTDMHISRCQALRRLRGTAAGTAIDAGELSPSHGLLLARIPSATIRDAMTDRVLHPSDGRTVSVKLLETWITLEVQTELKGCGFNLDDATLVPEVIEDGQRVMGGACADCPQRSINAPGPKGGRLLDLCLNLDCFKAKKAETHRRWMTSVPAGVTALGPEESARIFDEKDGKTLSATCGLVDVTHRVEDWEIKKGMEEAADTWERLTRGQDLPEQWIIDGENKVRRLAPRETAIAAALLNKHDIFKRVPVSTPTITTDADAIPAVERAASAAKTEEEKAAERAKQDAEEEQKEALWMGQMTATVHALEDGQELPEGIWTFLYWLLNSYFPEGVMLAARRRGYEQSAEFDEQARAFTGNKGAAALVEIILQQGWYDANGDLGVAMETFGELMGVDVKRAGKEALSALKKKRKEEAKAAKNEPVRARILRLAEPRGMTTVQLDHLSERVLGKGRTFESARGNELTAILEEVDELTEFDPAEGWIDMHKETGAAPTDRLKCPMCGREGRAGAYEGQEAFCACGFGACVPDERPSGGAKKGRTKKREWGELLSEPVGSSAYERAMKDVPLEALRSALEKCPETRVEALRRADLEAAIARREFAAADQEGGAK